MFEQLVFGARVECGECSISKLHKLAVKCPEAEIWIGWGIHVFRVQDGELGKEKGAALEIYLRRKFEEVRANPGDPVLASELFEYAVRHPATRFRAQALVPVVRRNIPKPDERLAKALAALGA